MRILIDTDVLLDLALERAPYAESAVKVLKAVGDGRITGMVAWHSVSNLYYILSSFGDRRKSLRFIRDLSAIVDVAPTDSGTLDLALTLDFADFEDAMQCAVAVSGGAEAIVTRNVRDFRKSPLPVIKPADLAVPS